MKRTSTSTARSEPIDVTRFSSITRSSFDWSASGISPISSRSSVPPLAICRCPRRVSDALVKAPLRKPNSSDSNSSDGMAEQFTATKALSRRDPEKCTDRASSSLPTPVSPKIRIVVSRSATERSSSNTSCIAPLLATTFLRVNRSSLRRRVARFAARNSVSSMAFRTTMSSSATSNGLTR